MRKLKLTILACLGLFTLSCNDNNDMAPISPEEAKMMKLSPEMQIVRDYVPSNAIVGHRGTSHWAPESTEAAYRWARNMGADYLEADLQITKDGVILVVHDDKLTRTTDINTKYPSRATDPTSSFTYEELMELDAGTWFNSANPDRARPEFSNQYQYISTLEDLIMIAQGKKIKRDASGKRVYTKNADGTYKFEYENDLKDNGNRPGIYIETKEPHLNPGLEVALEKELNRLSWNIITKPATSTAQFIGGKVNVGNTNGKVILQTFSHQSLVLLKNIFKGKIPTALLLWKGTGPDDMHNDDVATYVEHINFGIQNLAHLMGPSIAGGTPPENWEELLQPRQSELIHKSGMKIHPYSFDSESQMNKYFSLCEGMFTNQTDMTIKFYQSKGLRAGGPVYQDAKDLLTYLGY